MKPVIVFVDDEPHNLTVFEVAMSEEWEVYTFDNPMAALEKINQLNPWIVLSDQRMPQMNGVGFLELVKKVSPNSVRAIVTGFSEEDLVVESVRKAHIFDYIRKPWDVDDLVHRISIMLDTFKLEMDLREKKLKLVQRNKELEDLNHELLEAKNREEKLKQELEAWAPPFTLAALTDSTEQKFPLKKDLAVIACDIIQSSKLHGLMAYGKPIRAVIMNTFAECVIKHGGWRESAAGDSSYAHFGLVKELKKPAEFALAAANEFRLKLRHIAQETGIDCECGIALHIASDCLIDIHEIKVNVFNEEIIHKTFETNSIHVDLVHRMEKLMHHLSGSNIVLSNTFLENLNTRPPNIKNIGSYLFKGQPDSVELFVRPSDLTQQTELDQLQKEFSLVPEIKKAV